MKTLALTDLVEMLSEMKKCRIVTVLARTEPKDHLKSGNPYYDKANKQWLIRKIAHVNGLINWSYENAVNNQRDREQTPLNPDGSIEQFTAAPRQWGQRLKGQPFVEHKGKLYLEMKVQRCLDLRYVNLRGNLINRKRVEKFKPKKKESARQKVEHAIILRDFELCNIRHLRMNGEDYIIPATKESV